MWLGIAFLVFLLVREFWAWYFKINKVIDLLERIEQNTRPRDFVVKEASDIEGEAKPVSGEAPNPPSNSEAKRKNLSEMFSPSEILAIVFVAITAFAIAMYWKG